MLVIGEKINGTVEDVREAIINRDDKFICELARTQAEAGADYIDVNVGTGSGADEGESMEWAVSLVSDAVSLPLVLDSSDPDVLSRGLAVLEGSTPIINSVSGENDRMENILPLVAGSGCKVVALAMDESGIPKTHRERLDVCLGIAGKADEMDIPLSDIFFDPLVMPISADVEQGRVTLDTLADIKRELPDARTVLGLSNVSFGLPRRQLVNEAMLVVAIYLGLDALLMDPTDRRLMAMVFASEAMSGRDSYCMNYTKAYRAGSLG